MAARPLRWWLALRHRPRLAAAVALGIAVTLLAPQLHTTARLLLGFNAGALLYLALFWHLARRTDGAGIARRALQQDEGSVLILGFVVVAATSVLVAVGSQLATVKEVQGLARTLHVGLAAVTVFDAWLFIHAMFALHYAHDFYVARLRQQPDPLLFPGTADPDYRDFFYFSCVIGTSGQTADVVFQGSALRRVGTAHCILSFFFNATLIALAINIAAGLL